MHNKNVGQVLKSVPKVSGLYLDCNVLKGLPDFFLPLLG